MAARCTQWAGRLRWRPRRVSCHATTPPPTAGPTWRRSHSAASMQVQQLTYLIARSSYTIPCCSMPTFVSSASSVRFELRIHVLYLSHVAVCVVDSRIFVLSGHDGENSFFNSIEEYDSNVSAAATCDLNVGGGCGGGVSASTSSAATGGAPLTACCESIASSTAGPTTACGAPGVGGSSSAGNNSVSTASSYSTGPKWVALNLASMPFGRCRFASVAFKRHVK